MEKNLLSWYWSIMTTLVKSIERWFHWKWFTYQLVIIRNIKLRAPLKSGLFYCLEKFAERANKCMQPPQLRCNLCLPVVCCVCSFAQNIDVSIGRLKMSTQTVFKCPAKLYTLKIFTHNRIREHPKGCSFFVTQITSIFESGEFTEFVQHGCG